MKKFKYFINENGESKEISLDSFVIKKNLPKEIWNDDKTIKLEVRKDLLQIARDIIESLELESIEDVVVTGSIANYNWNKNYSDIDLHIIVDFSTINSNKDLVKKFLLTFCKKWNMEHNSIKIFGYPVEIYCQDISEPHKSSGIYSILDNKWIVEPKKENLSLDKLNKNSIEENVNYYIDLIDKLEDDLYSKNTDYKELYNKSIETFDNIKKLRNLSK